MNKICRCYAALSGQRCWEDTIFPASVTIKALVELPALEKEYTRILPCPLSVVRLLACPGQAGQPWPPPPRAAWEEPHRMT